MTSLFTRGRAALVVASLICFATAALGQDDTPVERGRYLVQSIAGCGNCHTPQGVEGPLVGLTLAGGLVIEEPGQFVAIASNITPDMETGIGAWTDEQIARAIREGIRPDGSVIGPPMPFGLYRQISDSDLAAMVAYLRAVEPIRNAVPASRYDVPLPPAWGPPVEHVPDVPRDDPVVYGAYLAGPVGHCIECHTPMLEGGMRAYENKLGAGGAEFHGPWGVSYSVNITSDAENGLGRYSDAEVVAMITRGTRPDGSLMKPPMGYPYYAKMTADDLAAVIAYLRALPPR